jgi:hypothetical protein
VCPKCVVCAFACVGKGGVVRIVCLCVGMGGGAASACVWTHTVGMGGVVCSVCLWVGMGCVVYIL